LELQRNIGLNQKLQSIVCLSKGVFCLRSSLGDFFHRKFILKIEKVVNKLNSEGQVPDMDHKYYAYQEEKWVTSYLHRHLRSQRRLSKRWFPIVNHKAHAWLNHWA